MNEQEQTLLTRLTAPFSPEAVKWRATMSGLNQKGEPYCLVAPYLDAGALQDRLDSVLGPENWTATYRQGPNEGIMCKLSLRINGEWIHKSDGASVTDIEPVRGAISNSFKRACSVAGIGRYLYQFGNLYGIVTERGIYKGGAKDRTTSVWTNFRWNPPSLPMPKVTDAQTKAEVTSQQAPKPSPQPPVIPQPVVEAKKADPSYEGLPKSLKEIFQEVKISPSKAMELVKRKGFNYAEVERILRDLLPELEKPKAA